MKDSEKKRDQGSIYVGAGVALGAGIGTAIGAALDNIGVGIAIGTGVGIAIGAALSVVRRKDVDPLD